MLTVMAFGALGDVDTHANDLLQTSPLRDLGLLAPQMEATFPSCRPVAVPDPQRARS